MSLQAKFQEEIEKLNSLLNEHRIGSVESYRAPEVITSSKPKYAAIYFKPKNEELFERILDYVIQEGRGFGGEFSTRSTYDSKTGLYYFEIMPGKNFKKESWLEETVKFLSHINPILKRVEKQAHNH